MSSSHIRREQAKILIGVDYNLTAIGQPGSKIIDCHNFHYGMPEDHMRIELFGGGHTGGGVADNLKTMMKHEVTSIAMNVVNDKIAAKFCPIGGFDKEKSESCAQEAAEGGPAAFLRCAALGPNFDIVADAVAVDDAPAEYMTISADEMSLKWPGTDETAVEAAQIV